MIILVKFPTRNRPEKAFEILSRCIEAQSTNRVMYMVTYDTDDQKMNNPQTEERFKSFPQVMLNKGVSVSKINACNRGIHLVQQHWDICVLLSDDMEPQVKGWDALIIESMKTHFPDTDGCLWFNDGYTDSRLCTMCILGRKYYDRYGYIYHPNYTSLWCDNEYTEVAKMLGKIEYSSTILFKHEHPANTSNVKNDELYKLNESFYHEDEKVYQKRKSINFGMSSK